jgi:hypothetical protein
MWPLSLLLLFCNYLSFEEDLALYFNNLEFPLPKDDLCQVWLKFACWFWRRRFFKIFSVFLLFCYYLPFGMGVTLHLNNLESPLPKDDLCQVWSKLAERFWRRSRKCKKFTDRWTDGQMDGQTDDGQQAIRKAHIRCVNLGVYPSFLENLNHGYSFWMLY